MTSKIVVVLDDIEAGRALGAEYSKRRSRLSVAVASLLGVGIAFAGGTILGPSAWLGADLTPRFEQVSASWASTSQIANVAQEASQLQWFRRTDLSVPPHIFGQVAVGQRMTWRGVDGVEHNLDVIDVRPLGSDVVPASVAPASARLLLVTMRSVVGGYGGAASVNSAGLVRMIVEAGDSLVPQPLTGQGNKAL
jgi:hypothetical protein